jgi:ABC-type transport system involved in multi-copper enzyme maturation permease subunit
MVKLIIKKEIQDILYSKKFVLSFPVISVLIILSFYVGIKNYQVQQRQYEAAVAENIRQMSGIKDWMQISHNIFLPPSPLYTFVNGISNDIGRTIEMYGIGELSTRNSRFNDDPLFAVFRFFDLEFLFLVILSLFAILFGYNMVNGEKESGTLRLVLANPIPKDKFILGKLTGALIAVSVPLLLPVLIGCLLIILLGIPFSAAEWIKLALIILTGLIYFGLFLSISIFISGLTHKSSTSFLLTLMIWIFLVLIIPRMAVLVGGRSVDVPSVDEVASQKSRYRSQLWTEDMKKINQFSGPETNDVEELMTSFQKFMTELSEERNRKQSELNHRLNEERQNRQKLQEKVAFNLARISPASMFSLTVTNLASTSITLKQSYLQSANDYQRIYAQFLREKLDGSLPEAGMIMRKIGDEDAEPINPNELPVFKFSNNSTSDVMNASIIDLFLLIILNLFFFTSAVFSFQKFDVR